MWRGPDYVPYKREDTDFGGARDVVEAEIEHLGKWRGREPEAGIALSGGGIRSASFGLGVLQALAHDGKLKQFDYLSTVSGGGYTGASLTYLLHQSQRGQAAGGTDPAPKFDVTKKNFPLLSYPMVSAPAPAADPWRGRLLRRLRQNAKYLAPGRGFTVLSLVAVVLRNSLASALVHAAALVILLELLLHVRILGEVNKLPLDVPSMPEPGFSALWLSLYSFAFFVLVSLLYLPLTRMFAWIADHGAPKASYRFRRFYDRWAAYALLASILFLILGVVPLVDESLSKLNLSNLIDLLAPDTSRPDVFGLILAVLGMLGNVWAWFRAREESKRNIFTSILVFVGSTALLFGVLLFVFQWTMLLNATAEQWYPAAPKALVTVIAAIVLFVLGLLPESTYVSLHRYYRDRLMETFMPDLVRVKHDPAERTSTSFPGETTMLGRLCGANDDSLPAATSEEMLARGPYPIINANVVLVASQVARYRGRGGDNFIYTPLVTGSGATGWRRTDISHDKGITLATAMAVSGAAINPNTAPSGEGITRQPVLSVLMSMFNIRLGLWFRNPNHEPVLQALSWTAILHGLFKKQERPNLIFPALIESFGRKNLTEDSPWILVTDGGHFENLGLYELVRRRLKLIVVCDGSHDPGCKFADLANAIEKVRADFGALIDITSDDLDPLIPRADVDDPDSGMRMAVAKRGYLKARIRYAARRSGETEADKPECGTLYYLTTTFYGELNADLYGYRREHPEFPDQSTGDQFFDEKQFEAYRELGFQTTLHLLENEWGNDEAELG